MVSFSHPLTKSILLSQSLSLFHHQYPSYPSLSKLSSPFSIYLSKFISGTLTPPPPIMLEGFDMTKDVFLKFDFLRMFFGTPRDPLPPSYDYEGVNSLSMFNEDSLFREGFLPGILLNLIFKKFWGSEITLC